MISRTVTLAACLLAGATSLAMAQNGPVTGPGGAYGNDGTPPKSYKGPGGMPSYDASKFQSQHALYDREAGGAYGSNGMPPNSYKGPGGMPSYDSSKYQSQHAMYDQADGGGYGDNNNNGMPPASYKGPGGMKVYKGDE